MDTDHKDRLKVSALLKEYEVLRADVRTNWVLWLVCITLSSITFLLTLIVAISSNQYFLLLFSPALSLFFAMIGLSLLGIMINAGIRLNKIEDNLNKILEGKLMEWESIGGGWFTVHPNIIISNIMRYVNTITFSAIFVGASPIVVGLILGLNWFYVDGKGWFEKNNLIWAHTALSWLIPVIYTSAAAWIIRLGIGLGVKRSWETMKVDLTFGEK